MAKPTCSQGQDGHRWLWAGQMAPCLLQGSEHPANGAISTTDQYPKTGHLGEKVEPVWETVFCHYLLAAQAKEPGYSFMPWAALSFSDVHLWPHRGLNDSSSPIQNSY